MDANEKKEILKGLKYTVLLFIGIIAFFWFLSSGIGASIQEGKEQKTDSVIVIEQQQNGRR